MRRQHPSEIDVVRSKDRIALKRCIDGSEWLSGSGVRAGDDRACGSSARLIQFGDVAVAIVSKRMQLECPVTAGRQEVG